MTRYAYGLTDPNQAQFQHHDRTVTLHSDQHGRPLHTLHAQHQRSYHKQRPVLALPEYHLYRRQISDLLPQRTLRHGRRA